MCLLVLLSEETGSNFQTAFLIFKTINAQKTNIFTVVKSFNEILVMKEVFENARILLYTYHIIKYVKSFVVTEYIVVKIKNGIMIKFNNMLYAQNAEHYDENKSIFASFS